MSVNPVDDEIAPIEFVTVPEVAESLGVDIPRVHQYVRDGHLLLVRTDGVARIPAAFIFEGVVVKGLPGVIQLLRDGNYRDDEILSWLYRIDPSLPGTPIQALRENRGTEIKRRAQAAGF
jgi:Rv2175c C-terminal domain of unknown function